MAPMPSHTEPLVDPSSCNKPNETTPSCARRPQFAPSSFSRAHTAAKSLNILRTSTIESARSAKSGVSQHSGRLQRQPHSHTLTQTTSASTPGGSLLPPSPSHHRKSSWLFPTSSRDHPALPHLPPPISRASSGRRSHRFRRRHGCTKDAEAAAQEKAAELSHGPVNQVVVDNDWESGYEDDTDAKSWVSGGSDDVRSGGSWASGGVMRGAIKVVRPFATLRFEEADMERQFQEEQWSAEKKSALLGSVFLVFAWVLRTALKTSWDPVAYGTLVGICGFFVIPLPIMVAFDMPMRLAWVWQPWLCIAVWSYGFIQTIEMRACDFFNTNTCQDRFLYLYGTLFGLPTIALLGMRQNRILHVGAACAYLILSCAVLLTDIDTPRVWIGNPISLLIFHMYLAMHAFYREKSDRQLFLARQQLVVQYRAEQDAQDKMRRADLSKKQFVSYIFHEVRVPLNTATLAVQNLQADRIFENLDEDDKIMYHGLISSLGMMENVLNDVLSFNRLESGQLQLAPKLFDFHQTIQIVALSHRAQAEATGVDFSICLDTNIDNLGGMFIGDEMRLKQLVSNLVSNALKFTHTGSVSVVTRLVRTDASATPDDAPVAPSFADVEKGSIEDEKKLASRSRLKRVQSGASLQYDKTAVLRVEVRDTGVGLRPSDVENNKLFSPYVQTEIGRRQGGKGSGLGLALVQQLIKLCRGRLGVDSEVGKGSTFWFELRLPVDKAANLVERLDDEYPTGELGRKSGDLDDPTRRREGSQSSKTEVPPSITRPKDLKDLGDSQTSGESGTLLLTVKERNPSSERSVSISSPRASISAPVPTSAVSPARPADATSPTSPVSALVVDDDVLTRKLMTRIIERLGHKVSTAEDGEAALQAIRERDKSFDVVFLDNQMPRKSGVEVVQELREMGSDLFVVGCTGNALREDQDEYLAAGADEILAKPVHQGDVVEMLRRAGVRREEKKDRAPPSDVSGKREGE